MTDEVWTADEGMDDEVPAGSNTTADEEEPEELEEYEDVVHPPHEFTVVTGEVLCETCDEYYDVGNHTN